MSNWSDKVFGHKTWPFAAVHCAWCMGLLAGVMDEPWTYFASWIIYILCITLAYDAVRIARTQPNGNTNE